MSEIQINSLRVKTQIGVPNEERANWQELEIDIAITPTQDFEEMQDAIERAIQELPEAQRMAVVMRRYQDVSYEEIAEVLELSVPAVKSVLFRARTELREKLRHYLES
jgi:RNA polymerase sigma-70 factor (ECF subfamily)